MMHTAPTPTAYVESIRDEFHAQVSAYRDLIAAASKASGASLIRVDAALAAFEPGFFNNLLISLDARFARHPRATPGDGDAALDEVRLLCDSLIRHGGTLTVDSSTRHDPVRTILKLDPGDAIALNADDFESLAAAFLDAIEHSQGVPP